MKYYVVSDVHGYCTLLKKALAEAGFFDEIEPCRLIVCGDLLDRGSEARELVAFMMRLHEEGKLILVQGNHEELFVQCLQEVARGAVYKVSDVMSHHYHNRTWDSLLQIGEMTEEEVYQNPEELVRRVMRSPFYRTLLPACVDYYETSNYVFVHGWIPCYTEGILPYVKYTYNPDWREADVTDWRRARWFNGMELACKHGIKESGKTIVCGHWHASYGHAQIDHTCSERGMDADFSPFRADGIWAIDAATPTSETVNCIVIED